MRLCPSGYYPVEAMHKDVQRGAVALFEVRRNGTTVAAIILTVEGSTLEICAFAGSVGGLKGIKSVLEAVELLAELLGLNRVWLQTPRPGLAKWVMLCGYAQLSKTSDPEVWVFSKSISSHGTDVLHQQRRQQ